MVAVDDDDGDGRSSTRPTEFTTLPLAMYSAPLEGAFHIRGINSAFEAASEWVEGIYGA